LLLMVCLLVFLRLLGAAPGSPAHPRKRHPTRSPEHPNRSGGRVRDMETWGWGREERGDLLERSAILLPPRRNWKTVGYPPNP